MKLGIRNKKSPLTHRDTGTAHDDLSNEEHSKAHGLKDKPDFKTREEENEFREFVFRSNPKYSIDFEFDRKNVDNPINNPYVTKAWKKFGSSFQDFKKKVKKFTEKEESYYSGQDVSEYTVHERTTTEPHRISKTTTGVDIGYQSWEETDRFEYDFKFGSLYGSKGYFGGGKWIKDSWGVGVEEGDFEDEVSQDEFIKRFNSLMGHGRWNTDVPEYRKIFTVEAIGGWTEDKVRITNNKTGAEIEILLNTASTRESADFIAGENFPKDHFLSWPEINKRVHKFINGFTPEVITKQQRQLNPNPLLEYNTMYNGKLVTDLSDYKAILYPQYKQEIVSFDKVDQLNVKETVSNKKKKVNELANNPILQIHKFHNYANAWEKDGKWYYNPPWFKQSGAPKPDPEQITNTDVISELNWYQNFPILHKSNESHGLYDIFFEGKDNYLDVQSSINNFFLNSEEDAAGLLNDQLERYGFKAEASNILKAQVTITAPDGKEFKIEHLDELVAFAGTRKQFERWRIMGRREVLVGLHNFLHPYLEEIKHDNNGTQDSYADIKDELTLSSEEENKVLKYMWQYQITSIPFGEISDEEAEENLEKITKYTNDFVNPSGKYRYHYDAAVNLLESLDITPNEQGELVDPVTPDNIKELALQFLEYERRDEALQLTSKDFHNKIEGTDDEYKVKNIISKKKTNDVKLIAKLNKDFNAALLDFENDPNWDVFNAFMKVYNGGGVYKFPEPSGEKEKWTETYRRTIGGFGPFGSVMINGKESMNQETGFYKAEIDEEVEYEGLKQVEIEIANGEKMIVDEEIYDKFLIAQELLKKKFNKIKETEKDYLYEVGGANESLEDIKQIMRIANLNYDDWEKTYTNLGLGFADLWMDFCFGAHSVGRALIGQKPDKDDVVSKMHIQAEDEIQAISNNFQKGIWELDDDFETSLNPGSGKFWSAANREWGWNGIVDQLPILAGYISPFSYGTMFTVGYGDATSQMLREQERTGIEKGFWNQTLTAAAYGGTEVILGAFPTKYIMPKFLGGGIMYGGKKYGLDDLMWNKLMPRKWKILGDWRNRMALANNPAFKGLIRLSLKDYLITATPNIFVGRYVEKYTEGWTQMLQNVYMGRPVMENVEHAQDMGFLIGGAMSDISFTYGMAMNYFSDVNSKNKYNSLLQEKQALNQNKINLETRIELLEKSKKWQKGKNKKKGKYKVQYDNNIKELDQAKEDVKTMGELIENLDSEMRENILKAEKKVSKIGNKFFKVFQKNFENLQNIRLKAEKIINSKLDEKTKEKELTKLKEEFDHHQKFRDLLKDEEVFGDIWKAFEASTDKDDVIRREELMGEVTTKLIEDGNANPSEQEINEAAEEEFYFQEITKDHKNKRRTKFGKGFNVFYEVEDAIKGYDKLLANGQISEELHAELVEQAKSGEDLGATITLADGGTYAYEIVRNAAKAGRSKTRVHEHGHEITIEAFGENSTVEKAIAQQLLLFVRAKNEALSVLLESRSTRDGELNIFEIIPNFMELVAEGKIDFESKNNFGLGSLIANLFGKGVADASNTDFDFDFEGEQDATNFIIGLAKKINQGKLTLKERAKIAKNIFSQAALKNQIAELEKATKKDKIKHSKYVGKTPEELINIIANPDTKPIDITGAYSVLLDQYDKIALKALNYDTRKGDIRRKDVRDEARKYLPGILNRFNPETSKFSTFVTSNIAPKQQVIYEKFAEFETEGLEKAKYVTTKKSAPKKKTKEKPKIDVLKFDKVSDKKDQITRVVRVEEDDTFKEISDNYTGEIGEVIFNVPAEKIIDPKKNLTYAKKIKDGIPESSEAGNIQDFYKGNNLEKTIKILPPENVSSEDADINKVGENIDVSREVLGKSLGLNNKMLNYFYNKTDKRSKGLKTQPFIWKLKPEFKNPTPEVVRQVKEDLGITPRGKLNKYDRGIGQLLKGLAKFQSQQTALSSAQRSLELQLDNRKENNARVKQQIANITTGQSSKIAYAKRGGGNISPKLLGQKIDGKVFKEYYTLDLRELINDVLELPLSINHSIESIDSYPKEIRSLIQAELDKPTKKHPKGKKIKVGRRTRNLGAMFNENTTFLQEGSRIVNDFLLMPGNGKYRDLFRKTMGGGFRGGFFLLDTIFNQQIPVVKDANGKPVSQVTDNLQNYKQTYNSNERYSEKAHENSNTKEFKDDKNNRLPILYDFFKDLETYLKDDNQADAWMFAEMILDTSKHQNTFTRVLAPFSFFPVDINGNPAFDVRVVEEHTDPQNLIGKAMFTAAVLGKVDKVWKIIGKSYMQGSLRKTDDTLINDNGLQESMPDVYYSDIVPRLLSGELDLPDGFSSIIRMIVAGVDCNGYMLNEFGVRITEYFGAGIDPKKVTPEVVKIQNEVMTKYFTGEITTKDQVSNELKNQLKLNNIVYSKNNDLEINLSKAVINSRAINHKTESRGMSAWDFDDTLATTKGGVRARIPNSDGTPQPGRKVIFLAGGAGSGKSNVVKKLNLEGQGFKIVNSDISLEWLKKNSGLPENMNDLTREQLSTLGKLQHQSRKIARDKMMKYQGNADGVVIDGTGGSIKAMQKLVDEFKDKGYDVSMLFVETSLETALERNRNRKERSLLDKIVIKNHEAVQGNKDGFKSMFGETFMEVKTDNLTQESPMPADLTSRMTEFVSSYKKVRLDAEQFALEGAEILEQGGEFDFSEFNQVVEGAPGPMLQTALNRSKKYGTSDTYVLTARPPEAAQPIREFLKSQGLDIPIENITGLGNSTGEAKAEWILGKYSEGYNNIFFADDAMQNVEAVKHVLSQLDIKSKVVQAKIKFSKKAESTMNEILTDPTIFKSKQQISVNNVRDINLLTSPDNYSNIKFSKKHRDEYENLISKRRPDLVKEGLVSQTVDAMFDYVDNLNIPINKKRKYEQITVKWLATSNIKLNEDSYKIKSAIELAEKNKEDIFSYNNPNEIIEKYAGKSKVKPTNPDTVELFVKDETKTKDQYGITEYIITEDRENNEFWIDDGQQAVRKVVDTHWGPKSNPWCIIARDKDGTGQMHDAMENWERYSDGPKRIVFQNGKLIAFYANNQYWDRMDNATDEVVVSIKEGRVTKKVELVPLGGGKFQEFVIETRTVSPDKKTVKTEYHVTRDMGEDTVIAGDYMIENRVNGQTVKKTEYRPDGTKYNEKFFKNGKTVETRVMSPDGRTSSVNNSENLDVIKDGDRIQHEITDGNIDYWFGEIHLESQDIESESWRYRGPSGKDQVVTEVGFQTKKGFEIMDVMKRVDGKLRLDLVKVAKIDPKIKGLPPGIQFSKNVDLNVIIQQSAGIDAKKRYSAAQAKLKGDKFKFRGFVPPSAQDFMGLLYNFAGTGKQGEKHLEIFKKTLIDPFARGINELNTARQKASEDYRNLTKEFPEIKKVLNEKIGNTGFTVDQAVRVYLWDKAGFEVPGLSKRDLKSLTDFVKQEGNEDVKAFAEGVSLISKKKEGYSKPGEYWLIENIVSDLTSDGAIGDARADFLSEWQENVDIMFSEQNLNKIQAIYGSNFREALEDILYRMKTGSNRPTGKNRLTNIYLNWVNQATGAIMFFNVRSAALQTISMTNYINWTDNNPLKAGATFANQQQFWSDFSYIFNSDYLKQRRAGNQRGVNEEELSQAVINSKNPIKAALNYLLSKGFLPTQIADSFAITMGGASFYRNRVKTYLKQGMSKKEAETKAFLDFQETTEVSQQSARPDMISQQQASPLGRLLLTFQNYPMQAGRIMNKAFRDLIARRGDDKTNISKIIYYGAIMNIVFHSFQQALFAALGDDDEEEFDKRKERILNGIIDNWLVTFGVGGKAISTAKNTVMEFFKQREKDVDDNFMTRSDHAYTLLQALSFSPPISSKLRKIYQSIQTEKFNRDVIKERGLTLDNPIWTGIGSVVEGAFNIPLGRISRKLLNLENAMDSRHETWKRVALILGWSMWDLQLEDPDLVALDADIKERKKLEKKMENEKKKYDKKRKKLEEKYPDKSPKEIDIAVKSKELFSLSKQEQIDLLKKLDISDEEIKKLKKEQDRTDKIAELYKDNSKIIDNFVKQSKNKSKKEKVKEKKKVEKPKLSKSEKREKDLYKMNKKDQVNLLIDLGLGWRTIDNLKYEKDRVEMIIKLQDKKK